MNPRIRLVQVLALMAFSAAGLAQTTFAGENKLDAHRRQVAAVNSGSTIAMTEVTGQVTRFDRDRIATDITVESLRRAELGEHTLVDVSIGDRSLKARVITREFYLQILQEAALRQSLDVDVVCFVDSNGKRDGLVISGISEGLGEWLHPQRGTAVKLVKVGG